MSDSESENNNSINNNSINSNSINNNNNSKYNNLRVILNENNLEKLYEKSEEDIISFLNGSNPKKPHVSGIEFGKINGVEDIQKIIKSFVIETDKRLDEKNMSVREIFEQLRDNILPTGMNVGEDFIERIPDSEINQKEKILLLMLYALHNTLFDE